jgi:hypothetical protein
MALDASAKRDALQQIGTEDVRARQPGGGPLNVNGGRPSTVLGPPTGVATRARPLDRSVRLDAGRTGACPTAQQAAVAAACAGASWKSCDAPGFTTRRAHGR